MPQLAGDLSGIQLLGEKQRREAVSEVVRDRGQSCGLRCHGEPTSAPVLVIVLIPWSSVSCREDKRAVVRSSRRKSPLSEVSGKRREESHRPISSVLRALLVPER